MDKDILRRVQRLYVALGKIVDSDLSKFPATVYRSKCGYGIVQDFSGGRSEVELEEALIGVINNIASFPDHLSKWGQTNGVTKDSIFAYFRASPSFCVIRDLWNNDKHGYPPRAGGDWSGQSPRMIHVHAAMQLRTQAKAGSTIGLTLGRDGNARTFGDGTAEVAILGELVDKNGNGIGETDRYIDRALATCEAALVHFGLKAT